jgi:hypothetical protein
MNETKEDMKTMQENIQENQTKTMEWMMTMNQAKTDANFKEPTETTEKTQMELQSAEMSLDARTRKLNRKQTRIAGLVGSSRDEDRAGKHTSSRLQCISATNIQWKYIVERVPATVRDRSREKPLVKSGEFYVPSYSLQGLGGRRSNQNPDKYDLKNYPSGT